MLPSYKGNHLKLELGTIECKIEVLQDFFEILKENDNFQGFVFRGQQFKSHRLEPTILRSYKKNRRSVGEYQKHVEEHYMNFITSLRGRFNEQFDAERDKYEIWALGQHFGLSTPLLDWTASPWVALYFAFRENRFERIFSEDSKETINEKIDRLFEERSVYFLNAKEVVKGYYFQIRHYFLECYENNTISYPSKTSGEFDVHFIESVNSKSIDKHLFYSKHEKKPKPIKGLDGMYSLKRLSEVI